MKKQPSSWKEEITGLFKTTNLKDISSRQKKILIGLFLVAAVQSGREINKAIDIQHYNNFLKKQTSEGYTIMKNRSYADLSYYADFILWCKNKDKIAMKGKYSTHGDDSYRYYIDYFYGSNKDEAFQEVEVRDEHQRKVSIKAIKNAHGEFYVHKGDMEMIDRLPFNVEK